MVATLFLFVVVYFVACQCSIEGSESTLCDGLSGQCKCKSGFTGKNCDRCSTKGWQFPDCTSTSDCQCNPYGTIRELRSSGCQVGNILSGSMKSGIKSTLSKRRLKVFKKFLRIFYRKITYRG